MCFITLMWAGSVTALASKASAALITFEANKMKNKNSLKHTYNCMQLQFFYSNCMHCQIHYTVTTAIDIHNLLLKLKSPTTQKLHLEELFMVTITTASKGIKQARKISQPLSKRPNMA